MDLNKDVFLKTKNVFWCVAIFAYFFQFPFSSLSALIVPCLIGYIALNFFSVDILKNRFYIIGLIFFGAYLIFLTVLSLFESVETNRIFRFLAILLLIPAVFCIRDSDFNRKKEIFIKFAVIKSIILIFFALIVIHYGEFSWFRSWAFENKLGDIYFLNRLFPKVQVHGNALLVVGFILDFTASKKFTRRNMIILFGVLCAGNFAFILALIVFFGWKAVNFVADFIKKKPKLKPLLFVGILFIFAILSFYVWGKIEEKSGFSNAVRLEQAAVLLKENIFLGNGLGNWIEYSSDLVSYSGDMYFEMQTLYIVNQIGFVGILLFYTITLMPAWFSGRNRFILYLIYLLFSFWNPYCFDTTQMITIILLMNTAELGDYNEKSDYYRLSPFSKC